MHLHDGQPTHTRHAQTARRANLSQMACFDFSEIALTPPPNQRHHPRRPALDKEGRFAIVTNVGRGMRWTHWRRTRFNSCGRTAPVRTQKRVVLASRR
jgi:hypothetical protein